MPTPGKLAMVKADQLPRPGTLAIVRETEAAELLQVSRRTLQRLRLDGDGPRFVKLTDTLVGYTVADLHAWIEQRYVTSTNSGRG